MKRPHRSLWPLLLLGVACAPAVWAPRTLVPETVLQWPFAPNPAKLTFARSLAGFAADRGAGSKIKAVIVGREPEASGALALPVAVAAGADGRIAVADSGRLCVHLYLPAEQRYLRLTGPPSEPLRSPVAVAFDGENRLFASDSTGRVLVFAPDGSFVTAWRGAPEAPFQRPTGLAWSPATGRLYVVDTLAHAVHALDPEGRVVASFGRRGEEEGSLNFPTHIAWSPGGELFVADTLNFRIQIFDESGHWLGGFGRHGDGSGDLAMPKGIAVDADGVVYVVDGLFDNVQLFDRQGRYLLSLGGRGREFGEFWLPSGAAISPTGELYVCDTYNRRIQVFRIAPGYVGASG